VAEIRPLKLLLDINVFLDFIQQRAGLARSSAGLFAAIEMKRASAYVAGHTLTTAYYIVRRGHNAPIAESAVLTLLRVVDVVPLDRDDLLRAMALGWNDFEDAVQAVCASKVGADYIVTRNLRDFRRSSVPAHDPEFILSLL
jgi:predicted nucleic acid-binding protein